MSRSQGANSFDAWERKTGKNLASFMTDGYPNHVKTIGDRLALVLGENPNLMILHLHRPLQKGKVQEDDLKSPYDGLTMEASIGEFHEKPTVADGMDTDKDDDDSYIA
ncbi:hypothetical protein OS493_011627 [Desmophyllum pertusum]|uniref:Uncharacterized protein n=1 Tax=Desmophyllum pertusum TaxID=174260 RepID=A0A9X0CNH9_9CNID|nr:hypothetical protein OS493_011627 [Desmophyllum pertusum]